MEGLILLEGSTYKKKYKCPYCDKRDTRENLIAHVNKNHEDMIPKDYTAARVVFNMINKKEHGTCVICGKETKWDEDKMRYDRFCGSKKCHDQYVKTAHKNTGIEDKLRDPEFQQKMLAGRSISGKYTFTDGGVVSYTGSYEKKLLEFMDKMLNVKSYDIESPGPVIEYEYNGEKHFWLTDQFYIPYRLVFDVKDGGNNPNMREMTAYREKQIAKENAIKEQGEYNYIRLTNNDFIQLLDIMLELKYAYMDEGENHKPIIKINESSSLTISALPPANADNVYFVDYMQRNMFDDKHHYAICKDFMQDTVTIFNGEPRTIPFEDLKEADTKVYLYKGEADFMSIIENSWTEADLYKNLTGRELLDSDQMNYDTCFEEVLPYTDMLSIMEGIITESLKSKLMYPANISVMEGLQLPWFELEHLNEEDSPFKYYRDLDGIFILDENTGMRTKSYPNYEYLHKHFREIICLLK